MVPSNPSPPKLLDQVRTVARVKHFSLSTERSYVSWIRRFILYHHKQHPQNMAETEIRQFISHLPVDAKISASTQTVALSALLFLYRDVLKKDLPYISNIERAKASKRLPVVRSSPDVYSFTRHVSVFVVREIYYVPTAIELNELQNPER